jgi:hypothetical protein
LGKYIVGNNAYVCSESLLTPFAGKVRVFVVVFIALLTAAKRLLVTNLVQCANPLFLLQVIIRMTQEKICTIFLESTKD